LIEIAWVDVDGLLEVEKGAVSVIEVLAIDDAESSCGIGFFAGPLVALVGTTQVIGGRVESL
jgi:hypothetical protein